MSAYTQEMRPIAVESPLGKDALLLTAFSGQEELSRLFHYHLELQSERKTINNKDIVGKNVTFWVEFPDGSPRYFNGIVQRFAYGGTGDRLSTYRAEVVPWLWLLTRTADCRIFQEKTVPEIIKEVVSDAGFAADLDDSGLSGSHPKWDYCVQYRESDFHFISRLMEEEGIFYFFKHEKGKHKLVLGDKASAYATSKDSQVQFLSNLSQPEDTDQIKSWEHQYEYKSGKWAQTDYNFETPSTSLLTQTSSRIGLPTADKFELFDYPGGYEKKPDGQFEVERRMEEEEAGYDVVQGESVCRGFGPGHKFTLAKHHNSAEQGKGYVVTSVRHQARVDATYVGGSADAGEIYRNSFTCIPDAATYRPPRTTKKPLIHGVQTAVVTGPSGEEIYYDKYGRIKVQFHWDRLGKKDDKTTCFIRCMQPAAGKGWGATMLPRIGQEVVVTYLEGDPDRPLVTGVVYNAGQMPPYDPTMEGTKWGMKSNSCKGGDGFNELRFEDKKDKEQVFIHAQKDMDLRVLNDYRENILNDTHSTIGRHSYEEVTENKDVHVKKNLQHKVAGNALSLIEGNDDLEVKGNRTQAVGGNYDSTVTGDKNEEVGTWSVTASTDVNHKAGMNLAVESGMAMHIKAGMALVIEAGMQLSLKVGGSFIDISPAGIAINGMPMTLINSGGAAGSGGGCSPKKPKKPKLADPVKPSEADNAKTGQKSCS